MNGLKQQIEETIMRKSYLLRSLGIVSIFSLLMSCNQQNNTGEIICPVVPNSVNVLVLKEKSPFIFLKKESQDKFLIKLSKGYRLNLLNRNPQAEKEKEIEDCQYQAELTSDIKDGLSKNLDITQGSFWIEKQYLEDFPQDTFSLQFLLPLILSVIQTLIIIISLIILLNVRANQKRSEKKIREGINKIPNEILNQLSSPSNNPLDSYYQRTKKKFNIVSSQITELKELNLSALSKPQYPSAYNPVDDHSTVKNPNTSNDYYEDKSVVETPQDYDSPSPTHRQIDQIIENFNNQNKAYFSDYRFVPLGLTQESRQGSVGAGGYSKIQLQSFNNVNQDSYLKIELEGDNWLIPNADSPYLRQTLKSLQEYPQIFSIVRSGINKLTLIKPAKLEEVSSGIWEIAEIGEFET
jgi:hypothetical protein